MKKLMILCLLAPLSVFACGHKSANSAEVSKLRSLAEQTEAAHQAYQKKPTQAHWKAWLALSAALSQQLAHDRLEHHCPCQK